MEIVESSGNVFADMGLPNPEERLLKAQLATEIQRLLDSTGTTQAEQAERLGVMPTEIANRRRGRLEKFSVERLFSMLNRLGCGVEVHIIRTPQPARTRVVVE